MKINVTAKETYIILFTEYDGEKNYVSEIVYDSLEHGPDTIIEHDINRAMIFTKPVNEMINLIESLNYGWYKEFEKDFNKGNPDNIVKDPYSFISYKEELNNINSKTIQDEER